MTFNYSESVDAYARYSNAPYIQFLRRMGLLIEIEGAQGILITDSQGCQYIDCIAGYGNCFLGHNPGRIIRAVSEELTSLRPFNLPFINGIQARFYQKLAEIAPGDLECCFAVNSGSEAVETALKLARLSTGKSGVVSTTGSWHGFTFGCMSVSEPSMCGQFMPFTQNVRHVPFGVEEAVENAIDELTGCVIVEPIQSENGAVVPESGYLKNLEEICRRRKVLLIFDEVKTGIGKTGAMFACDHDGAVPDILVCGKALGGGVMPIGAVIARRTIWGKFGLSFPMSSSSGAGNAPACAAGLATLEMVESEKICQLAESKGNRVREGLEGIAARHPGTICGVDGRGLLQSISFVQKNSTMKVISECARSGVLVMNAFCDRSKILVEPPVCIGDEEITKVITTLEQAIISCK
ncbi:MAG: aspartate aminotransferase family protein [Candidatus Latescibacteria bacterium]|nr:aspartate aminotransferase family protein [Candidatus Latescibacterota bacterium]